jgi:hypothetical protein
MQTIYYSTGEAARLLGVPSHRLVYAIAGGKVREPRRLLGKRAFRWPDLVALASHFGVSLTQPASSPEEEAHV